MTSQTINEYRQLSGWSDWRWQLSQTVRTVEQLKKIITLPESKLQEIEKVLKPHQGKVDEMRLTPFLLSLIDWENPRDPIALQHLPSEVELISDNFSLDKIWEQSEDFADGENRMIQQKYPDVILLRLSNTCHSYCRFCFQKERTLQANVATKTGDEEFKQALRFIASKPNVRQVLISGGDPLILTDEILLDRLQKIIAVPHITTVRLNTRALLHNPFRVTAELAEKLGTLITESWKAKERGIELKFGVHFNHPHELSSEGITAIRLLQKNRIQVYNQSVLLRGINDNPEILTELFRTLRKENIELHYLSVAMAVPRTSEFRTTVKRAQEIMTVLRATREFRGQLPHLELSHHTGKQIVPETMTSTFFVENGIVKFFSDITHQWENFPDSNLPDFVWTL